MHPRAVHWIAFNPTLPTTAKTINIFSTTRDRPINSSPFPATGRVRRRDPFFGRKMQKSHKLPLPESVHRKRPFTFWPMCGGCVCVSECGTLVICVLYYFSVYEAIFLLFCQKMVQTSRKCSEDIPSSDRLREARILCLPKHIISTNQSCSLTAASAGRASWEETEFVSAKERQQKRRSK